MKDTPVGVRAVRPTDAEALAALYRYYVEETAISFEYAAPDAAEFRRRIEKTTAGYPYFVAVQNGEIVGYAYAGPFIPRAAYDCSAELSIYVKRGETGKGIGKLLYHTMERALKKQGIPCLLEIGPEGGDERLAEEFDLSVRHTKTIVYECEKKIFSHFEKNF